MKPKWLSIGLVVALIILILPAQQVGASTFTVNTTSDENDGSCSDGDCSLRDAIILANNNPGNDTIEFEIPMTDPNCMDGICTIYPGDELPWLSGGGTTIDGYSQTGATRANASGTAVIKIQIDGHNLISCGPNDISLCNGLLITSSNNVVEGLSLIFFNHNAIAIGNAATGASADNNVIKGNYLGVSSSGITAPGNGWDGVLIGFNASGNTVGGDENAERNVISGNNIGVEVAAGSESFEAANNVISGNYIGTNHSGTASLPNVLDGIWIRLGAKNNKVGGGSAVERNVISGNGRSGVRISGSGTDLNTISANYVGIDKNGSIALGNVSEGVFVGLGAKQNTVGGDSFNEQNVISGNLDLGVILTGTNTISNTVSGNMIGLHPSGSGIQRNSGSGVYLYNASHNQIGGNAVGERNYISGSYIGVAIFGPNAHDNAVIGNYIGTNSTGNFALGNQYAGVVLALEAHDNQIGSGAGGRNVISGNGFYGVTMDGTATGNRVFGNYIGTDTAGEASIPNDIAGVALLGSYGNTIGSETFTEWNVISGNDGPGVKIVNGGGNTVSGNLIGLTADMNSTLPNDS